MASLTHSSTTASSGSRHSCARRPQHQDHTTHAPRSSRWAPRHALEGTLPRQSFPRRRRHHGSSRAALPHMRPAPPAARARPHIGGRVAERRERAVQAAVQQLRGQRRGGRGRQSQRAQVVHSTCGVARWGWARTAGGRGLGTKLLHACSRDHELRAVRGRVVASWSRRRGVTCRQRRLHARQRRGQGLLARLRSHASCAAHACLATTWAPRQASRLPGLRDTSYARQHALAWCTGV
jgi:hypothetical protein